MKITFEIENEKDAQAAHSFLGRALGATERTVISVQPSAQTTDTQDKTEKPGRKPRSDAGKPREPYGPRTPTTGEPVASEPGVPGSASAPTPQPAAPATPTQPSAPADPASAPQATSGSATVAEPAAEDQQFPRTEEGVRLAMQCLNKTKGQGTEACWAALKAHGVVRITELPKEKFDEFIKYVLAKSSKEGIAEALKVGAPPKKGAAK